MSRNLRSILAGFVTIAILAGCAGSVATPTGSSTPAPGAKKTVILGVNELVKSFDPPTDWAIAATWVHANISDCLVWRNRETAVFEPWLAEKWEVMDSKNWKFFLRKGVSFHNGEPFNAAAAKFTIDRILADTKMLVHRQWIFIEKVTVIDDYTIQITTKASEPAMLSKMAGTGCQVLPPKYTAEVGPEGYARKPVGVGAFKFVEERKDDRIILAANADYWQGKPDIDELVFRALPEAATRINELLTGGVDLAVDAPPQDWDRINSNNGTKLEVGMGNRTALFHMRLGDVNGKTYITANPKVREALEVALDKNKLVQLIGGMGVPTRTRVTPPTFAHDPSLYGPVNGNLYNLAKAKQLLQEAGYKNEPIEMVTSTGAWLMSKEVAEAMNAMWKEAGINSSIRVLDVRTYRGEVYLPVPDGRPTFKEINMDPLGNSFFDPWVAVASWHSSRQKAANGADMNGFKNAEVDRLMDQGAINMDFAARAKQYQDLQQIIANERPTIFLYHMKESYGMSDRLKWEVPPDGFLWMGKARVAAK